MMTRFKKYLPQIIIVLILLLGAFFRFYKINQYMTFLGDEGRDVLVVKRMLIDHKFTLLGPITSVGSMYMGPIYYYFMAPFLWLWNFNPVGPAIMVALFAVATVFLIYKLGREYFHPFVGLIAAFLYAISPIPITSGRSSWNPNIVPFFSVLLIYALITFLAKKKVRWMIVVGLCLGVLIQLHYVTSLFILVIAAVFILLRPKIPIKNYLLLIAAFIAAYSPFLLFEVRHDFVNLHAVLRFVLQQNAASSTPFLVQFIHVIADVFTRLYWRLITISSAELAKIFILITILSLILYAKKYLKQKESKIAFKIMLIWGIVGIFSYGIYRGVIYDYYFGSLFAFPFLTTGIVLYTLWQFSKFTKALCLLIFLFLTFILLKNSPLFIQPNNMLANTEEISKFVYKEKDDKPYNFALIAGRNSDHAYRYFLELWGDPPVTIENPSVDPKRQTVTDRLIVVCEEKVCQPLGHPLWEIAGFGRAEIVGQWPVVTTQVFKLVHYNK